METMTIPEKEEPTIVAELLSINMDVIDKLVKVGKVSLTVRQELDIYQCYLGTRGSKMQRYSDTAEEMGVSVMTVRRAVMEMKKVV